LPNRPFGNLGKQLRMPGSTFRVRFLSSTFDVNFAPANSRNDAAAQ
jgi:hypothetical protein